MPTVNPSPFGPKPQIELASGIPAVGYKLFFYVAGSVNTKQNTYTDSAGTVANTNPIVLNTLGQPTTEIWFTAGQAYKVVLAPSTDTDPPTSPVWSVDNLRGINDTTVSIDQWVSGPTPTYISATQFSLVGDQTSTFHIGRRIKATVTAGTVYGTITNSAYAALTTVTVSLDSGALDSGLSAVSYGLLSKTNQSVPYGLELGAATAATAANGDDTTKVATTAFVQIVAVHPPNGRLTLTSATPVTTGDVTGATTVYYTPYGGNTVPLWDGTRFVTYPYTEMSQATTDASKSPAAVTTNKVYDVFVWNDSGTLRATRGPAWTTNTNRGTGAGTSELQMVNGIWTNKNAITNGPGAGAGTYVGSIGSDGSSQINDSVLKRDVWNLPHAAVERSMIVTDATNSWNYTTATWRQANGSAANQVEAVIGLAETMVEADVWASANNAGGAVSYAVGVGVDVTNANSAQIFGQFQTLNNAGAPTWAKYRGYPGVGLHTFAWLEISTATGVTTWYGDIGGTL